MAQSMETLRAYYPEYEQYTDEELVARLAAANEQGMLIAPFGALNDVDMGGTRTLPPSDPRHPESVKAEREAILQEQERPIHTVGEDERAPQIAAGDEQRAARAMAAAEPAEAFPNISVGKDLRAPTRPDYAPNEAMKGAASGLVKIAGNTAAGALMIAREGTQGDKLGDSIQEKIDAMPPPEGMERFTEVTTQFLVPFGIFKPGVANFVSRGKKLLPAMLTPKAANALTSGATNALTSGATGATAFSGQQHRLADYLVTFPQMKNSFTEYLASDPEDTQAEGRLKNAIEFATVDAIIQGTLFLALKGIKGAAAKSAPDGDIDMALALENVKPADAKSIRQGLARPQQLQLGHKPQLALGYKPTPGVIPLGLNRGPVIDLSLKRLSEKAFEARRASVFKELDNLEAKYDANPSRVDTDLGFRKKLAKLQDQYEAFELETFRRQMAEYPAEDVAFELRQLGTRHDSDKAKVSLLINEVKKRGIQKQIKPYLEEYARKSPDHAEILEGKLKDFRKISEEITPSSPPLTGSHSGVPDLPEAAKKVLHKAANAAGKAVDKLVGGAGIFDGENLWRPISSRIAELDPKSLRKLYQYEMEKGTILTEEFAKVEPFLKSLRKLPPAEKERVRKFWMNSDMNGINQVLGRHAAKIPGGTREFKNVRDALEDMYDLARENGEEVFYRREYLPRIVRDYEGMKAHRGTKEPLQLAIDAATKKKGTPLTMIQEREVIGEYMNKLYRGDGTPGYMKNRVIDVVPQDLMKYYGSVEDMLTSYVQNLTNRVAKARYVGKSPMLGTESGYEDVLTRQIQLRKLDPKRGISVDDAAEVRKLIQIRLGADATKVSTGGKIWRDIVHMTSIANPISTITQTSEVLINAHRHGYLNTIEAAGKQMKGSPITLSKIGVTDIAAEYADIIGAAEVGNWAKVQKGTNKTLEFALGASGFRKVDAMLKNNNLNGAFIKARKLVGNKGTKAYQEFAQEQAKYFGKETKELMDAIRANDHDNPLVKEYLFHQLSGTQPISLSEYPVQYLKAGAAGRSFYYLKSFSMKMLETTRRDVLRKLASSDRKVVADGMKQLVTLTVLSGGVAGVNKVKSLLLDRDESWGEAFVDGVMLNFGLSKYAVQKFRSDNPDRRAYSVVDILAPAKFTEAIDVGLTTLKEGEVPTDTLEKQVPWAGKIMTEWFGAAAARKREDRRKKSFPKGTPKDVSPKSREPQGPVFPYGHTSGGR